MLFELAQEFAIDSVMMCHSEILINFLSSIVVRYAKLYLPDRSQVRPPYLLEIGVIINLNNT